VKKYGYGKVKKIKSRSIVSTGNVAKKHEQNRFMKSTDGIEPNRAHNSYRRMISNKGPYRRSKLKHGVHSPKQGYTDKGDMAG
jgi:hypothetical protein